MVVLDSHRQRSWGARSAAGGSAGKLNLLLLMPKLAKLAENQNGIILPITSSAHRKKIEDFETGVEGIQVLCENNSTIFY
jgi:hypothetical protein